MKFTAFERTLQGTGASRRLRNAGKVPGIVYGAGTPALIELDHNALYFALKKEAFHSSILEMELGSSTQKVLLRDFQMHAWKQQVLHVDFQRVDEATRLRKKVPLHFTGEENSPAVKADKALISHVQLELEIECLASQLPEYVTIDIAHGHAESVRLMIGYIKEKMPSTFVIAGNVATPEAVIDLENWGADATKVGVGPGKVCITKLKTGFGTGGWQLSALKWCARVATKPIIADGGIRSHGDIAKSVRFGATMVMIGSLFAGHEESPGHTVEVNGELFKEYYGSASDFNKGEYKHVEGKRILEPIKGPLMNTLVEMQQDVQSSISYAGGTKLMDIRKVNYVILGGDNAGEHLLM